MSEGHLEISDGRTEMAEALKLVRLSRQLALEVIEHRLPIGQRRAARESMMAAAHALRVALEDVERWAGP